MRKLSSRLVPGLLTYPRYYFGLVLKRLKCKNSYDERLGNSENGEIQLRWIESDQLSPDHHKKN